MRESNHDKKRVSTTGLETGLPSRRHFLATLGKGAALASLGIFRCRFGCCRERSVWQRTHSQRVGGSWTKSAPEAGYDRPLGEPF